MPASKKKTASKTLKKGTSATVFVIESPLSVKDTLFPEKVAKAKKILRNARLSDKPQLQLPENP